MSDAKVTLKSALVTFLKNNTAKQPTITLDCNWSHSLKLSDHKNYYFVSKKLKKKLKEDEKVPDDKTFKITLSKWSFVVESTKKGMKEIDLDVKKYSVKKVKEDIDFSKRTRDLLDYPDVKSKLETEAKGSVKKAEVKKGKAKAGEKLKELRKEPKSPKKVIKETPTKLKIAKKTSGLRSAVKTLKSRKTANRIEDKPISTKMNGKSSKKTFETEEISYEDIITAREFENLDRKRSTTKTLKFQTANTQMSRMASPHQVNQENLHRLSSALGRVGVQEPTFENFLPDSLKKKALNYKEFLVGKNKGLVSANEIIFSKNAIDMYLKDFKGKTSNPYN